MARMSIRRTIAATLMAAGVLASSFSGFGIVPAEASTLNTYGAGDPYGENSCSSGYVWREANPQDLVCVVPSTRTATRQENSLAASRRNPRGAYGPNTCISGYVWREAYAGDVVCVTPASRSRAHYDNAHAFCHMRHEVPPSYC